MKDRDKIKKEKSIVKGKLTSLRAEKTSERKDRDTVVLRTALDNALLRLFEHSPPGLQRLRAPGFEQPPFLNY
jgi:hypothetical protein